MLLETGIKKFKETLEGYKEMLGLLGLTGTIIITFFVLNIFFGVIENTAKNNKTGKIYKTIISSLPKGRLNYFKSSDGHQLSPIEYEAVCKNTKIVTQRSIMGANITNYKAQRLYTDNGNKIDKYSVKWVRATNKCFAEYTIRAIEGKSDTITVSGEAKGFLKTSLDTRVYFIKNF
tara:strand:+ start:395 stop:922 length:528 start_codon:yes stop_codon:yes gene_type:complete